MATEEEKLAPLTTTRPGRSPLRSIAKSISESFVGETEGLEDLDPLDPATIYDREKPYWQHAVLLTLSAVNIILSIVATGFLPWREKDNSGEDLFVTFGTRPKVAIVQIIVRIFMCLAIAVKLFSICNIFTSMPSTFNYKRKFNNPKSRVFNFARVAEIISIVLIANGLIIYVICMILQLFTDELGEGAEKFRVLPGTGFYGSALVLLLSIVVVILMNWMGRNKPGGHYY